MLLFIEIIIVGVTGLIFGSFATALSWRVPRGESWIGHAPDNDAQKNAGFCARSACPHCGTVLRMRDLVPLFSWLMLRGRCRYCNAAISVRYPLTELVTMAGCLGVYLVWGFTVPAFIIMAAIPLLVALLVIDLDHMILPNQLVALSALLALSLIVYQGLFYGPDYGFGRQALSKLAAALVYAGTIWLMAFITGRVLKKQALGMGDVKFFAMAGLWLGLGYLPFFMIVAGVGGIVFGLYFRLFAKTHAFPFGPALICALYACLLLQGLEIVPIIGVQLM